MARIIIMHGVMAHKNVQPMPFLARKLAKSGFVCVRFDFNAQGDSEGDLLKNTVPSEIDDAEAMYTFVQSLPYAGNISLLGHSQGGVVAAKYKGPVCIVQGSADHIIPMEDVENYLGVFRDCRYTRIEGANHLFSWHWNRLVKIFADFFKN